MDDAERVIIEKLQKQRDAHLVDVAETERSINVICKIAGEPPLYPDVDNPTERRVDTNLRSDRFYGKALATAAREVLEMRGAANLGPASVNEIFEVLKTGGYEFTAKTEANSKRGLYQALSKNSSMFHRLPGGEYGLTRWYEKIKKKRGSKAADDAGLDDDATGAESDGSGLADETDEAKSGD